MIPEGWKKYKLGEIADYINRGIPPLYSEKGLPVVNQRCIRDGKVSFDLCRLTNSEKRINSEKLLISNDILINSTGQGTLGRVGQVKKVEKPITVDSHVTIVRIKKNINPIFVGYILKSKQLLIESLAEGSTGQTELSRDKVADIDIIIPSLSGQTTIASILSSLDDKIELNLQMNKTLEAIAQAIFKEWFVDFRFPGFDGEMVDELPHGWKFGEFGELFSISKDTIMPSGFPSRAFHHYSIPAFDESKLPVIELGETILSNKFIVKPNSILFSKLNPRVPRIWPIGNIDSKESICSTEFIVLQPREPSFYAFVVFCLKMGSTIQRLEGLVTGTSSSHQRIKPLDIKKIEVIIPNVKVIEQYSEMVSPMIKRIISNIEENRVLGYLRDTLLPKLITGKIRIPENDLAPK